MNHSFISFTCSLAGIVLLSCPSYAGNHVPSVRLSQYGQMPPVDPAVRLRKIPRLGMQIKELELLWGPGLQDDYRNYIPETEPNKKGLRGMIFNGGVTYTWEKGPLKMVASFVDDKCVSLLVYLPKGTDKESAIDIMKTLMPNVTFMELDKLRDNVKLVSKEKSGAYTFSFSTHFNMIFLEAPGQMNLPNEKSNLGSRPLADILNNFIKTQEDNATKVSRKDLLKKKRTGLTRKEWEILMGPPDEEKTNWKSSQAIGWKNGYFTLRVTFEKDRCNQIILFNENMFSPAIALEFMQKLMPGCRFEKKNMNSPTNVYVLSSIDARKRYKAVWTRHSYGKWQAYAMEIVDNYPENS